MTPMSTSSQASRRCFRNQNRPTRTCARNEGRRERGEESVLPGPVMVKGLGGGPSLMTRAGGLILRFYHLNER